MDSFDFPVARSPRKELQGPRPPALKVRKDSHKIKKPPVAPNPNPHPHTIQQHQSHPHSQPRAPIIIYTVSPKVIHTNPGDFMNLVQRLTGSSSAAASSSSSNPFTDDPGAMSPAARYATIEKAKSPKDKSGNGDLGDFFMEGVEMGQLMGGSQQGLLPPGILSPGPASLPPISSSATAADPSSIGFFHDLVSPAGQLQSSRNFLESGLLPSPSSFFSPQTNSPFPSIDLFNNFNSGNFDF
ncbi:unnamed protein product [Linum tenue]|uniref:VQ domain-containing protein n=1 Tax=Linum tenue TaxID=586396 RepID=A0AAV0S0T7_9ROSI|nr:unnamed protein product [Linum tenue]